MRAVRGALRRKVVITILMDVPGKILNTTISTFPQFDVILSIEGNCSYYSHYCAVLCYGPFVNSVLLNLVHFFLPVYYGDQKLYQPQIGDQRQCFAMRCTILIKSTLLLRVLFQGSTSRRWEGAARQARSSRPTTRSSMHSARKKTLAASSGRSASATLRDSRASRGDGGK